MHVVSSHDRGHFGLYCLALFSVIAGLFSLMVLFYLFPHVVFGLDYQVPELVHATHVWAGQVFDLGGSVATLVVLIPWFVLSCFFFFLSAWLERYLEVHHEPGLPHIDDEENRAHKVYGHFAALPQTAEKVPLFSDLGLMLALVFSMILLSSLSKFLIYLSLS